MDSGLTTNLFGYNMRSELADAIMGTNLYAYLYDPIGNRQLASANEVTNLYQANELNQYTNINEGAVEPVYDADGNMTSYGSWQFTWDAENRLVKVTPHYLITGSRIYEYGYDYMSRRVKKTAKRYTMPMSTWTMRTFDYDGWNLVRERVEFDGAVSTNQYVWGLDLSGSLQGAGGVGGLLAILSPDSCLLTPAYDANGNITDLVDTNGAVVAHYEYDPYGNTIAQSGAQADVNPFRFSSKYWDGETGFYYYGFRFYSPELGRFISRDPVDEIVDNESLSDPLLAELLIKYSFETEIHPYHFVNNSPVQNTDMLGLKTCSHIDMYWECQCPPGSKKGKRQKDKKETNGCSYPGWLPQPPGGVDNPSGLPGCSFLPACDSHDCCYGSCGADKGPCDNAFFNGMKDICNSCTKTAADKKKCMKWAERYHWGVDKGGGGAYKDNQKDHCEECCCD